MISEFFRLPITDVPTQIRGGSALLRVRFRGSVINGSVRSNPGRTGLHGRARDRLLVVKRRDRLLVVKRSLAMTAGEILRGTGGQSLSTKNRECENWRERWRENCAYLRRKSGESQ